MWSSYTSYIGVCYKLLIHLIGMDKLTRIGLEILKSYNFCAFFGVSLP